MELLKTEIGGTVAVDGARLKVAQQFDDVPFSPIPSFWCGHPELLTPTVGWRSATAVRDRVAGDDRVVR